MSDDYDEVDELEKDDDQEEEEVAEAVADDDEEQSSAAPAERGSGGKAPPRAEIGAEHSIAARQAVRDEMERQIQEFLARGGKISQIDPNVTADPPRKPEGGDYGGRAI